MPNPSERLIPLGNYAPAPGRSGDIFQDADARKNVPLGSVYVGADSKAMYVLVQSVAATPPADGDLCVFVRTEVSAPATRVDAAASGDVGEARVAVYVSAIPQNQFGFVKVKGLAYTWLNGSGDNIAASDALVLGAANDLTKKVIGTPTAASAGREAVATALEASTANESAHKAVYLHGAGIF